MTFALQVRGFCHFHFNIFILYGRRANNVSSFNL